MAVKKPVACSQCNAPLMRLTWHYGKNRPITASYCDNACKGAWQVAQREALGFTREWLHQKYVVEGLGCPDIAKIAGRNSKQVWVWITNYGLATRPRGSDERQHMKKGAINLFAGRRHSEATRKRMSDHAKAVGRVPYDPTVGSYMMGRKGADTTNWKGGVSAERQAFYASPEWKAARAATWARAQMKCERCGVPYNKVLRGKFDVHHKVSFMVKSMRAEPINLVLLCEPCHYFVHSRANVKNDFIVREIAA